MTTCSQYIIGICSPIQRSTGLKSGAANRKENGSLGPPLFLANSSKSRPSERVSPNFSSLSLASIPCWRISREIQGVRNHHVDGGSPSRHVTTSTSGPGLLTRQARRRVQVGANVEEHPCLTALFPVLARQLRFYAHRSSQDAPHHASSTSLRPRNPEHLRRPRPSTDLLPPRPAECRCEDHDISLFSLPWLPRRG